MKRAALLIAGSALAALPATAQDAVLRGRLALDTLGGDGAAGLNPLVALAPLAILLVSGVVFLAREVREERKDRRALRR